MKRQRWWIGAAVGLVLLLAVAYIGVGVLVYNQLTPVLAKCGAPGLESYQANTPASFKASFQGKAVDTAAMGMAQYEDVTFPARGEPGIVLSGWFIPAMNTAAPASEPVVIVVHGLRRCKRDPTVLLPASMLVHHGFNVLLIDLRNHGDSTVQDGRISVGIREYRDVLGAWDWLQSKKGFAAEKTGILGESLGAGTTAIAFGEEPRIAAVWLDSPYADMTEVVRAELARTGYPTFFADSAPVGSQLVAGFNIYEKSPLLAMDTANNRPIFITHGTADARLSVTYSHDLIARIQSHGWQVDSWFVQGIDHVFALYTYPEEYSEKLVMFFTKALRTTIEAPA